MLPTRLCWVTCSSQVGRLRVVANNQHREHDDHRSHSQPQHDSHQPHELAASPDTLVPELPGELLGDQSLDGRGNEPVRVALMRQMQQTYGNRALQRYLTGHEAHTPQNPGSQTIRKWQTSRSAVQRRTSPERAQEQTTFVSHETAPPEPLRRVQRVEESRVRPTVSVQRELWTKAKWQSKTKRLGGIFGTRGEKNPILLKIDDLLDTYPKGGTKAEKEAALGKLSIVRDWLERTRGKKNDRLKAMEKLYQNILGTYRDEGITPPEGVHIEAGTMRHPALSPESQYTEALRMAGETARGDVVGQLAALQKDKP